MARNLFRIVVVISLILLLSSSCSKAAVAPQGGAKMHGKIDMDKASSAAISLIVSEDGSSISTVSLSFINLKCEGFSAGSTENSVSGGNPITNGEFQISSDNFGEINGKFTKPTSAEGTLHLAFFDGKAECGTWKWSASAE